MAIRIKCATCTSRNMCPVRDTKDVMIDCKKFEYDTNCGNILSSIYNLTECKGNNIIKQEAYQYNPCEDCGVHPNNGGSGHCNCALGVVQITQR